MATPDDLAETVELVEKLDVATRVGRPAYGTPVEAASVPSGGRTPS
jgi:hypothetical protein